MQESISTKSLGLQIDNHIKWKNHIDLMFPKLSRACYAIRLMPHISNTDTLKSIYFAYFHSIMKYGIIFGGNSPNSKMIFALQKRTVRNIAGVGSRNSCRNLFIRIFQRNSRIPCVNSRNKDHHHRPTANFSHFQKSAYYADIKILKNLP
jgi:hypothetical protein